MKREQRAGYLGLTTIDLPRGGNPIMCTFCRYGEYLGGCKDGYYECTHALLDRTWDFEPMMESVMESAGAAVDCWGFRPCFSIDVAADIVGYWLQGMIPDWKTVPWLVSSRRG